jgi:hypothetical protein
MPSLRRADLDALAYRLRAEGLTYQAIAERLGVKVSIARRRVVRYGGPCASSRNRRESREGLASNSARAGRALRSVFVAASNSALACLARRLLDQ